MGFVRVSGYNEEDLERARQEGSAAELNPIQFGVAGYVLNNTITKEKYYPDINKATTKEHTINYFANSVKPGNQSIPEIKVQGQWAVYNPGDSLKWYSLHPGDGAWPTEGPLPEIIDKSATGTDAYLSQRWSIAKIPPGIILRTYMKLKSIEGLLVSGSCHIFVYPGEDEGTQPNP